MKSIFIHTGNNCVCFKLKGKNICNLEENHECIIKVFLGFDHSHITLKIDENNVLIPLSHDEETKKELLKSLKWTFEHNSNPDKVKMLGHYGSYLNIKYREKETTSYLKNYPTTITHNSLDNNMELTIVINIDTILKFPIDFSLEVLIKVLERNNKEEPELQLEGEEYKSIMKMLEERSTTRRPKFHEIIYPLIKKPELQISPEDFTSPLRKIYKIPAKGIIS